MISFWVARSPPAIPETGLMKVGIGVAGMIRDGLESQR